MCQGFNYLYATINSADPNVTHASCAPTNAYALLVRIDQERISIGSKKFGSGLSAYDSIYAEEASKLSRCFVDLINAASVLRTVDGFTRQNAPAQLAPHLTGDGRIRHLVDFEQRYPTVRL